MSPSELLMYATVRIVGKKPDGTQSIGTAFIFTFSTTKEGVGIPVIVTNKHVVSGCSEAEFYLHEGDNALSTKPASAFKITVADFHAGWVMHPGPVDLCAMAFEPIRKHAADMGKQVYWRSLDESVLPTAEQLSALMALEDVVMVGYPIGLWDEVNYLPLLRRGVTASHPATNWKGQSLGVADIAAFPGSSGSPVFILNIGSYATASGLVVSSRIYLLGVLSSGPVYQVDGTIAVQSVPTAVVPVAKTPLPIHLGFYVKAKELLAIKELFLSALPTTHGGKAPPA